jgi:hypothetical protein
MVSVLTEPRPSAFAAIWLYSKLEFGPVVPSSTARFGADSYNRTPAHLSAGIGGEFLAKTRNVTRMQ